MLSLVRVPKSSAELKRLMQIHYSRPKGFVGRQLHYEIYYSEILYGCISFGSATRHLPGREIVGTLNNGLSNTFYHIEKVGGKYPIYNFTTKVLLYAEKVAAVDYRDRYGDSVFWLETLVELPRTGDLYIKAGYSLVGQTKGYTCKRVAGYGTDSWSGKRVWDCKNLRPKNVFVKNITGD